MNIFVFDTETIPDVNAGRRLHDFSDLSDHEVAQALFKLRRQDNGTEFLRLHMQQIVAISVVLRTHNKLKVWSLGEVNASESELIQRFFAGIDKYQPILVSWNGCGFDLPVLHYRALLHQVSAPRYWEMGEEDQNFRWNNYLNRFHYRHMDLMDILAGYQARANAPLDEMATLLGFPGKMGMQGSEVWNYYQRGDLLHIRHYCETGVLNTYLIYLRFEVMRGKLTPLEYTTECLKLRELLQNQNAPHFNEFLAHWQA